jgi:hypothetical protein
METTKTYKVKITKEFPNWDEKEGFEIEVEAKSKSEATKRARREMEDAGHIGPGCGRAWLKAEEKEEEPA